MKYYVEQTYLGKKGLRLVVIYHGQDQKRCIKGIKWSLQNLSALSCMYLYGMTLDVKIIILLWR